MSSVNNSREVYCRLEGWLYKLKRNNISSIIPQWNKRYFTIEGMYLKWYKSPTSSNASSFINILEIEKVSNFEKLSTSYNLLDNNYNRVSTNYEELQLKFNELLTASENNNDNYFKTIHYNNINLAEKSTNLINLTEQLG